MWFVQSRTVTDLPYLEYCSNITFNLKSLTPPLSIIPWRMRIFGDSFIYFFQIIFFKHFYWSTVYTQQYLSAIVKWEITFFNNKVYKLVSETHFRSHKIAFIVNKVDNIISWRKATTKGFLPVQFFPDNFPTVFLNVSLVLFRSFSAISRFINAKSEGSWEGL